MVYGRQHQETLLTFLHSGSLWHDALVLMDEESGSLWSQVTGRSIAGVHESETLTRIPSTLTTWGDWSSEHPDTWALPSAKPRRRLKMVLYPKSEALLGVLGTENPDRRLPGKTMVVGFHDANGPVAVALRKTPAEQIAYVELRDRNVLVRHRAPRSPIEVWSSSGPPDWKPLERIAGSTMYWFVWSAVHPNSRILETEDAAL